MSIPATRGEAPIAGIVAEPHPSTLDRVPQEVLAADLTFPPLSSFPPPITMSRFGGPIAAGAPVQLVFWGDAWALPTTTPSQAKLTADVASLLAGPWRAGLKQYGIGRIPFRESIIVEHAPPPAVFNDSDVNSLVATLANANAFHGEQDLIIVLMPPGTTYGPGGIRGKHWTITLPSPILGVMNFWIGLVLNNSESQMTSTLSHELAEMLTDPEPSNAAWVVNPAAEIGDPCNNINAVLNGVTVQSFWSRADNACLVSSAFSVRKTLALAGISLAGKGLRSIENPIPSLNGLIDGIFGAVI